MTAVLVGYLSGESLLNASLSEVSGITGYLSGESIITGLLSETSGMIGELSIPKRIGDLYEGAYEITPNFETQILSTADKSLTENIIVYPIPSNYGLITWDGSTLTVS